MKILFPVILMMLAACNSANVKDVESSAGVSAENTMVAPAETVSVAEPVVDSDSEISLKSTVVDYNQDELLSACIRDALENDTKLSKKGRFSVAVYDKSAYVVGGLSANEMMDLIKADAITCEGILEVKNLVISDKNPSLKSLKDKDEVIYSEIMKKLADDVRISAENYRIAVYKGKVYVIGTAADKKEQRDVFRIIRRVKGITNIINYIGIKK